MSYKRSRIVLLFTTVVTSALMLAGCAQSGRSATDAANIVTRDNPRVTADANAINGADNLKSNYASWNYHNALSLASDSLVSAVTVYGTQNSEIDYTVAVSGLDSMNTVEQSKLVVQLFHSIGGNFRTLQGNLNIPTPYPDWCIALTNKAGTPFAHHDLISANLTVQGHRTSRICLSPNDSFTVELVEHTQ